MKTMAIAAACVLCLLPVVAQAGPIGWFGGGYSRTLGHELGGEVWFPKSSGGDGAKFLEVIGGFNFDGTAKLGGGVGLFSEDLISLDVKAYGLASTTAGGRQGWGVSPGFAFFVHGRSVPVHGVRIRAGFDWGHVDGKSRPGVSVLVQIGPFGR